MEGVMVFGDGNLQDEMEMRKICRKMCKGRLDNDTLVATTSIPYLLKGKLKI